MCDTFVALPPFTRDSAVIFGKNSDREPNEAQVLEYHPGRTHAKGECVRTTYVKIPQVRETYGVLLSRPFWMWGAEMGANEKGVVIGNEAVFTRMPMNKKGGLTGMDLLRLALERSGTASQALNAMVQLIADHGQGGICGFEDKKFTYHNSFIIADPNEAWVLETIGPLWVALKVKDVYAISNGLTIGEEFDAHHPQIYNTARKKGWLKKGEDFHFAQCYSNRVMSFFSGCRIRQSRSLYMLNTRKERLDTIGAFEILRDHGEGPYRPDSHFLISRICAHSANRLTRNAGQTNGSFVAHLAPGENTYWATGTAAPCLGVFKPIWFQETVLPNMGPAPTGAFDPDTLWWLHERLHRLVIMDYARRSNSLRPDREDLERSFVDQAVKVPRNDRMNLVQSAFRRPGANRRLD